MVWENIGFTTIHNLPTIPEDEFVLFGHAFVKPEHADAIVARYAENIENANNGNETGMIHYSLIRDDQDPTVFHFFERYKGKWAFEEHAIQPYVSRFMADDLLIGVKAKFLRPIKPGSTSDNYTPAAK